MTQFNKFLIFLELAIIFYATIAIKPLMANDSNDLTQSNRTKLNEDDYSVYYQGVEGRPGVDFPVFSYIPRTGFSCKDMESGYYADLETNCQVFHICEEGKKISFLCPNGTIFQQQDLICEWWFKVNCTNSPNLYDSSAEQLREDNLKRKAFRKVKLNGDFHNHGAVMRMEEASTVTATKNGKHIQVHVHQKQSKPVKSSTNFKSSTSVNGDLNARKDRLRDATNNLDTTSFGTDNSVSTENFGTTNGQFINKYNADSTTSSSINRLSISSKPFSTTYSTTRNVPSSTTFKSTTERFLINANNNYNENQDDFPLHESEKPLHKTSEVVPKQKSTVPLNRNDITNRRLVDESDEAQIVQETASFVNNNNRNNIYSTPSTTAFPYPNHRSTYSDLKTPSTAFGSFSNSHKYNSINSVTPQLITTQSINNGKPFIGTRVGTTVYSTAIPSTTTETSKSTLILGVLRHNSSVSSNVHIKSSTNTVQSTTSRPRSTTAGKKPKSRIITSPTDTEKEVNIIGVSGRNSGLGSTTPRNVIRLSVSTNLNQNNGNANRNGQGSTDRQQSDRAGRYQEQSTTGGINNRYQGSTNNKNNYQSGVDKTAYKIDGTASKNSDFAQKNNDGTTYNIESTIYNHGTNNGAIPSTLQPPFEYTTANHASTTRKLDHSTVYGTFSTVGSTAASKINMQSQKSTNLRPAVHVNDVQSTLSPEFSSTTAAPTQFTFGSTASTLNAQAGNNKHGFYVTKTATPAPSSADFKLSTSSSNYYSGTNFGTNGADNNGANFNSGFNTFESRINNFDGSRTVKPRPFQPTSFGSSVFTSTTTQAPFTTPFYKISSASPFAVTRNELNPTLPTTLATPAPSNSVYENVDNMINVLMEIANANGAKKEEEESEDYSGETPRPGLIIPPSAGPQTLHTLATYFASALDDIVQERQKYGQEKLDKESLTNLLTEMTRNHYEELFKKNRQNNGNSNNPDSEAKNNKNNSSGSNGAENDNGSVNNSNNNGSDKETNNNGSSNKDISSTIDFRSNSDDTDENNGFRISVDDSINETLETGHSKNLVQSPEIRQLARNFSQALSSYLESPDDFRMNLQAYRPTEPPPLETDNETGNDNDDELLNFSDSDSKSSYPPIFPTSPSIPAPTWGYIFAFNNSYVKSNSLDSVNQKAKTDKDNENNADSGENKTNGDYERNSLNPDLQSADSQSFIPRFNDVSSATKVTPAPGAKLSYTKSVTQPGNTGTSPSSPSSSGGPTYLPKKGTTPSSKNFAYVNNLETSSVNPLPNPLPDNHWTASPDATKLWQKTFSVNPVALNQHFASGSVKYETTTEPLQSEEQNTQKNLLPEREIKYELRSLPKINLNSTQVHGILIDFMNSSVTDDNNRLQRILRKLNTSESEFLSRMKEIEGNPLTRRLILLLISECGADLAKEVRHLDAGKLKDVEVFDPQPGGVDKEEVLAQRQEKLQQLLPPLNRGQKVVVTREEKSTRNHELGRLVSPTLESDNQDARALQLLNSLYTIASRFGK